MNCEGHRIKFVDDFETRLFSEVIDAGDVD